MPTFKLGQKALKEEWVTDIMFFKQYCQDKWLHYEEPPELKKRKQDVEDDFLQKKAQQLNVLGEGKDVTVNKAAGVALQALGKELAFEEMVEREELLKEKDEYKGLMGQYNDELLRGKCIERSIKKKKDDVELKGSKAEVDKQVDKIRERAKNQVMEQRATQRKTLEALKRAAERRKQDMKNKIDDMRSKNVYKLEQAEKIGDMALCQANASPDHMEKYCNKYFDTDPQQNKECRNVENFCYICCENEFGDVHIDKRDKCYEQCQTGNKDKSMDGGKWVYIPDQNNMAATK